MAIPNVKPGGGSFPVFNGASEPNYKLIKTGQSDYLVLVQFDFSSPNGFQTLTDDNGNTFKAFVVDFSSLGKNVVLPSFRSLLVSIDFDPVCDGTAPYTPLQIADSLTGQLLYVGIPDFENQIALLNSAKASACFPLVSIPGSQVMFSKRNDIGGAATFRGAGVAIFTTQALPPFSTQCVG